MIRNNVLGPWSSNIARQSIKAKDIPKVSFSDIRLSIYVGDMSTEAQPVKDVDCDNWCRTVSANTTKSTFMWTIENFNERPEERNESLKSSEFSVTNPDGKKTKWQLKLFPKGQDPEPFYTGKVSSDDSLKEQAREILAAANMYQLDLLKKLCEAQLVSTLNASNCLDLLVLGDLHQATKLKKASLNSVSMNLASLIEKDVYIDFLKQYPELVFEVTKSMVSKKESSS